MAGANRIVIIKREQSDDDEEVDVTTLEPGAEKLIQHNLRSHLLKNAGIKEEIKTEYDSDDTVDVESVTSRESRNQKVHPSNEINVTIDETRNSQNIIKKKFEKNYDDSEEMCGTVKTLNNGKFEQLDDFEKSPKIFNLKRKNIAADECDVKRKTPRTQTTLFKFFNKLNGSPKTEKLTTRSGKNSEDKGTSPARNGEKSREPKNGRSTGAEKLMSAKVVVSQIEVKGNKSVKSDATRKKTPKKATSIIRVYPRRRRNYFTRRTKKITEAIA